MVEQKERRNSQGLLTGNDRQERKSEFYVNMIMLVVEDLGKEILAVSEGILVVTSCMTAVRGV